MRSKIEKLNENDLNFKNLEIKINFLTKKLEKNSKKEQVLYKLFFKKVIILILLKYIRYHILINLNLKLSIIF